MGIFANFFALTFVGFFLLVLPSWTHAQQLLFSLENNSAVVGVDGEVPQVVRFASTASDSLSIGTYVQLPLPSGELVTGTVTTEHDSAPLNGSTMLKTSITKTVSLDNNLGSVDIHLNGASIVGVTMHQIQNDAIHRAVLDSEARGTLFKEDANDYLCVSMPVAERGPIAQNQMSARLEYTPSLFTVQNLQSNPLSKKVLYIDYWGGRITNTSDGSNVWNVNFGDPLIYDAFDVDDDSANFSSEELYRMYHAWLETAEDFATFDINVTTSQTVYDSTLVRNRSRIIATTFDTRNRHGICASSCGGVAYRPSFGSGYFNIGFTFNNTIGSMGMTHSHEAGHQMGLGHDGTSIFDYYNGHGDWGPIMGTPFNKKYVQWSKGEYLDANNRENDIAVIHGKLGMRYDDVGNTAATAEQLETSTNIIRSITPNGAVTTSVDDLDFFRFDLDSTAMVDIEVAPRFGLDTSEFPAGESRGSNLALHMRLFEQSIGDIVLVQPGDVAPLAPKTNKLIFSGILNPGSYFIEVNGKSPNVSWIDGFGEWGHGGEYRVKVNYQIVPPPVVTDLVSPTMPEAKTIPTFIWSPVMGASEYRIFVAKAADGASLILSPWQDISSLGCESGICSFSPQQSMSGSNKWRVQARNSGGKSSWSAARFFSTKATTTPNQVSTLRPVISSTTYTPTYTWLADSLATDYRLQVKDKDTGTLIVNQWMTISQAQCVLGLGECSATPNTVLPNDGNFRWWIQARNSTLKGPWSLKSDFSTP